MSNEPKKDAIGVVLPRLVRRGWRTFLCDECGYHYEAATRDAMSPSGDTCPKCNNVNFPTEHRIDAKLPCDDYGNLRECPIIVFPKKNMTNNTEDLIPAIESAILNICTACDDCDSAERAWLDDNWDDCVMWINNAIAQLESARAKIKAHHES